MKILVDPINEICFPNVNFDNPSFIIVDYTIKINKWRYKIGKKYTHRQSKKIVMNYIFQMFYVVGVTQNT